MRSLRNTTFNRRRFLKAAAATGALAAMPRGPWLYGQDNVLNFSNWPYYIDDKTNADFEAEFGIRVNYVEEIGDNDDFFAVIAPLLERGQDTGRDLIVLTDWMASRLIRRGWVEELNKANMPNWENMRAGLKNVAFDPGRRFSLVWQSGFTAIGYNKVLVKELTGRDAMVSINDIFDPGLKGRVTMLTEMRDTLGLTMLALGRNPENATLADAQAAVDHLKGFVDNGHIRAFTDNSYADDLAVGNVVAAYAWSGDVIQLQLDNPDLEFLFPQEGFMLFSDNMMIPLKAAHKEAAETYMNFYYRPNIQAQVEAYLNYITPVEDELVKAEMANIDASLLDNPLIFPSPEDLAKTKVFKPLDDAEEEQFNALFQDLIGA